jgi:hypothetical protein
MFDNEFRVEDAALSDNMAWTLRFILEGDGQIPPVDEYPRSFSMNPADRRHGEKTRW